MSYRRLRLIAKIVKGSTIVSFLGLAMLGMPSDALAQRAFPGCEGYGCETQHGRNGSVCIVSNTNNSGSGSFRDCMMQTGPRIIIFRVSGTITTTDYMVLTSANSNVAIYGQTAPGDGIQIRSGGNHNLLSLTSINGSGGPVSDILIQHVRFRHGCPGSGPSGVDSGQLEGVRMHSGANHIVLDHIESIWSCDEAIPITQGNIHDITVSNSIIGEGGCRYGEGSSRSDCQNAGLMISLGSPHYNYSIHHNLFVHTGLRNPRIDSSNNCTNAGIQVINNVMYNTNGQATRLNQNQYTGPNCAVTVDIRGNYYKAGPDGSPTPVILKKETLSGPFQPMSLNIENNTRHNINGSLHSSHNDNNYGSGMLGISVGSLGPPTWVQRNTQISPRPEFPVTETTSFQAYQDVVVSEDVGPMPHDTVSQRLIDAPENGDAWNSANCVSGFCSGSHPTLNTFNVPTDTDNDGVPDSYESAVLGTNPSVFDSQAVLDHDGDGYKNIEEWIHSLLGGGTTGSVSRPNPPDPLSAS